MKETNNWKRCLILGLIGMLFAMSSLHAEGPGSGAEGSTVRDLSPLMRLKGTWEGTMEMEGVEQPILVDYRSTSGGTAVVETLFRGTPNEMVSIYYRDRNAVMMTHYCKLDNQPRMRLRDPSNKSELVFDFVGCTGLKTPLDPHMHGLTITLLEKDKIEHAWTYYDGGKESEVHRFTLTRKSE